MTYWLNINRCFLGSSSFRLTKPILVEKHILMRLHQIPRRAVLCHLAFPEIMVVCLQEVQIPWAQRALWHLYVKMLIQVTLIYLMVVTLNSFDLNLTCQCFKYHGLLLCHTQVFGPFGLTGLIKLLPRGYSSSKFRITLLSWITKSGEWSSDG